MNCIVVQEGDKSQVQRMNLEAFKTQEENWSEVIYEQMDAINGLTFKKDINKALLSEDKCIKVLDF